ncbi:galactokinase [Sutcliffiella deserti]|uniref:galactokinase n=1 Tax=Sutcliffiella deserti TaxID=2875501 RepID=UPI001CC1BE8B|nr:galactokinase [Sutcliffiella deserti]
METKQLIGTFEEIFTTADPRVFFAPGRINLIGEHTDYNGGNVFPCAITYGTYAIAKKRSDQKIRMYSSNFPHTGVIDVEMDRLDYNAAHDWANYPKGMVKFLNQRHQSIDSGFDVLFYGNIPNGAGLSSSASIELVTGVLLENLFNLEIDRIDLVKLGQQVENQYIGVNSGIMDQFAIGMGKKDHGILLDCTTLEYEYAPLELEDYKIIIMNTNKQRTLATSKYNERRNECEKALVYLQQELDVLSLGAITEQTFEGNKNLIEDEVTMRRARHAVTENARTEKALHALKDGRLNEFGKLMNLSHISLRDDYEVTGLELDTLVEAAWEQEGTLGARMTGAGFGGCAIAIVEEDKIDEFIRSVGDKYLESTGLEATFYIASIGDGAKEIKVGG